MSGKLSSANGAALGYDYNYVTNDVLLNLILEQVAGMPFEQFVQTAIFAPLEIQASYDLQLAQHPNVATTYRLAKGEAITFFEEPKQMDTNAFNPPAFLNSVLGLSMSSSDMAKLLVAVLNQDARILSPEGWNIFLGLEQSVWGTGGWWARMINNVDVLANVGGTEGSELFIEVFQDSKIAYVVMSNYLIEIDVNPVYQVLGSVSMGLMMFDESSPFRSIPFKAEQLNDPSESNIERIVGNTYASAIGDIEFYKDGNQLKSNILNHEVLFKQNRGLGGFVTQSDYAPLDGLVLEIHRTGIDMWFRQFAYKTN
jgi:CubicO group peptidase (beta-lactamase class C family)